MPVFIVTNKLLVDNIATLTTSASHGMSASTYFTASNIDATFNGSYNVIDVPTPTTFTYSKTAANVSSTAVSGGSVIYAIFDSGAKPAFMYDEETDQWKPIAGIIDTGRNYTFTGSHIYQGPVTFEDSTTFEDNVEIDENLLVSGSATFTGKVNALSGINVFADDTERDAAITSPETGTIVYLVSTNQQLVYNGIAWVVVESGSGMEDIFLLMGA
jgi:hypothetical protein